MKEWLTREEAAYLTHRSRRTIRRWVNTPAEAIRTRLDDDERTQLLNAEDIVRVEGSKTAYLNTPTFPVRTA